MKEQHTPSPWFFLYKSAQKAAEEHPGTDGGGASGIIGKKTGRFCWGTELHDNIAFVPHFRDPSKDEENEANFRLMAAAPELLDACQSVMNWQESADPLGPILAQVEKAIKKATS